MAEATLLISSKNYSSWCLRGWLITRLSGLPFREEYVDPEDPAARAELLLRSSSILVPTLIHGDISIWDTLAIAEYLNELRPSAQMLPHDRHARARCRAISGEMHSGFAALRSALPMNLHADRPGIPIWSAARADIDRILTIWEECFATWNGPYLFGARLTVADAMYAPVVTRFLTYGVALNPRAARYCQDIMAWPDMAEWVAAAKEEPQEISELEVEF
ncbi:glutathione S-transferase family protein [Acidisoma sp. C75]